MSKIFSALVFACLLGSSPTHAEQICWKEAPSVETHYMSIDGIPVRGTPIIREDFNFGTSLLIDHCMEVEIPHPVCMSRLSPWIADLRDRYYRDDCRFDMDGDEVIGMNDLARAIVDIIASLNTVCGQ